MALTDKEMALKIAQRVADAGGRTFYVGGYVRDMLMGRDSKDIDIEIHGVTPQALEEILDSLGERLSMGESFGIMGLKGYDIDIAMPRCETATGRGHRDFTVFVDPFIGAEKAAMRRDFTVNAMMCDVLTGEILDFFGGRDDIAAGRLRHVNDASFAEDPLRVYRAAQFAARFGFSIAEETAALARTMDVRALTKERIFGELEKALLKAKQPSIFFEELRRMDALHDWFPELEALIGVQQDPIHHPEGDVWVHTMQVMDVCADLREKAVHPLWLMLAALMHDLGKPSTYEESDGRIHNYGHESAGVPIAQALLERLTSERSLTEYVRNMVLLHMEPNKRAAQNVRKKSYMKLFDASIASDDLLLLAEADHFGRHPAEGADIYTEAEYAPMRRTLQEMLAAYRALMKEPQVMGRDLVAAGVKPGPLFSGALALTHRLHLSGVSKQEQLAQALGYIRAEERKKK